MKSPKSYLNSGTSTVNIANVMDSVNSNIKLASVVMLLNTADNLRSEGKTERCEEISDTYGGQDPVDINVTLGGELFIDGRKVDPKNPVPGYIITIDRKSAKS